MRIGFIGLGNMGAPMAANLVKAGYELVVFDVVKAAVDKIPAQGAMAASSPKALAAEAVDAVITMLPSSKHAKTVYLGEDGVLAGVKPGVLLVDCSTIDPYTTREIAASAAKLGNPMVDAPVSGGTGGAKPGRSPSWSAARCPLSNVSSRFWASWARTLSIAGHRQW